MAHRCLDISARIISPPLVAEVRITSPRLVVECRTTCDIGLSWEVLRDSEGRELRDVNGEKLRVKRKK